MTEKRLRQPGTAFIETPVGIFTPSGNWFHTSTAAIKQFVPGLMKKKPLNELIRDAEVWIRSADNLSILLLLILLVISGIVTAVMVVAIFLPLWHIAKSGVYSRLITVFLRFIDIEIVLLLFAVGPLSWLGMEGYYYELIAGLAGFIILKFGLYRRFIDYLYNLLNGGAIPLNDRLFRMVLVKHALANGIRTDEVAEMDKSIRELINKRKKL